MKHKEAQYVVIKRQLRSRSVVALACALLTSCASSPNSPNTVARSGDGVSGTGLVAQIKDNGDGVGGTGITARIGGDGIGGTGVVGTISGFGSIVVNGLKLQYNIGTAVESDGRPAALTDLRVGQVIEAVAERHSRGGLQLERLEIRHAVTGPISEIDHNGERLVVLGQTVQVNLAGDRKQNAAFAGLKIGDVVRVSGLRLEDGVIIASRLDQSNEDTPMLIRGPVSSVAGDFITIGGLDISLAGAALADTLTTGGRAFVSGRMLDNTFAADVVMAKEALPFDNTVSHVSLEGYVPKAKEPILNIQGVPVSGVELPSDVKAGDRIIVTGRISASGSIVVREIERARTVITVLRPSQIMRPSQMRPATIERPERIERPTTLERPAVPERPRRERPQSYRPPMV